MKRIATVALLGLSLTIAAPAGYWAQMQTMLSAEDDYNFTSEDGRIQIWKRGMSYMQDYAFGVGIGNFGRAEGTISSKAQSREWGTGIIFTAPHNSFVEAGAEMGVVGFVLWTSLVVGGFFGMLRLKRRVPAEWRFADSERQYAYHAPMYMAVAFLGFASTAFFVTFAYLDPIYILAAFAATLYTAVDRLRRSAHPAQSRGRANADVPQLSV
jgi:O-antigen ligase